MAMVTFKPSSSRRRFSSRVPNRVSMLGLISMFFLHLGSVYCLQEPGVDHAWLAVQIRVGFEIICRTEILQDRKKRYIRDVRRSENTAHCWLA